MNGLSYIYLNLCTARRDIRAVTLVLLHKFDAATLKPHSEKIAALLHDDDKGVRQYTVKLMRDRFDVEMVKAHVHTLIGIFLEDSDACLGDSDAWKILMQERFCNDVGDFLGEIFDQEPARFSDYLEKIMGFFTNDSNSEFCRGVALQSLLDREFVNVDNLRTHVAAIVGVLDEHSTSIRAATLDLLAKFDAATLKPHSERIAALLRDGDKYVRQHTVALMLDRFDAEMVGAHIDTLVGMVSPGGERSSSPVFSMARQLLEKLEKKTKESSDVISLDEDGGGRRFLG